jgi:uncharacterized protein YdcH (DUF465 family)
MPTDMSELRTHLLQVDEEFRKLVMQHHELDERIHALTSKPYLNETERFEEVTLKKKKLHLKDRMEEILRQHRNDVLTPGRPATLAQPSHP